MAEATAIATAAKTKKMACHGQNIRVIMSSIDERDPVDRQSLMLTIDLFMVIVLWFSISGLVN